MLFLESDDEDMDSNAAAEILAQLKEAFYETESKDQKYRILTSLPRSWPATKIQDEFGISMYMATKAKALQKEKGIMSTPDTIKRIRLDDETKNKIISFYKDDDISRVCPGKRDYVSVLDDGTRILKQKRLVLCNLREAYQQFKNTYPMIKVGFSKFAELRPRECLLADLNSTHSVCVCMLHQNVKLMFDAMKRSKVFLETEIATYRDVISKILCNPPTEECYVITNNISTCSLCPRTENFKEELKENFFQKDIERVEFKLWVNTDRCSMETLVKPSTDFVDIFVQQLIKLVPHSFIATQQAQFLKKRKEELLQNEFVVISDFSENYSFVVQDEVQGMFFYSFNDFN